MGETGQNIMTMLKNTLSEYCQYHVSTNIHQSY